MLAKSPAVTLSEQPTPHPARDWQDAACRYGMSILFAVCTGFYLSNVGSKLQGIATHDVMQVSQALSILAISLYSFTIACLYILRLPARHRASGWKPVASALLGGFMIAIMPLMPMAEHPPVAALMTGNVLVLGGNILAVISLMSLGRSFSILPESRALVTKGLYRFVRHPVYLAEGIAAIGVAISFMTWPALLLVMTQLGFQLARMHYEEKSLRHTFPEYESYSRKTARLIPFLY
ncbi:MAG: isoprenylcysteine carboxylmethyltransferase family protein [Alphaproteobacteria bacterium]|nr:isoprenylcysteine carboxylmethyltransferase family protein [Alphaproteobacteria bacterium]MBV8549616.1 isoprenylcysteine carboxylmethyltransferase family protein [Alphaproteobacteria bacterium]